MILPATTRVRFNELIRPLYMRGCTGTVIHKQPGEERYLVQIDNDPKARRFAGGAWCVDLLTIEPVERGWADEKGKRAAEAWMSRIAPKIEEESKAWADLHLRDHEGQQTHFALHHPQLLWRFYYHLSVLLAEAAQGWETIYHTAAEQEKEQEDE